MACIFSIRSDTRATGQSAFETFTVIHFECPLLAHVWWFCFTDIRNVNIHAMRTKAMHCPSMPNQHWTNWFRLLIFILHFLCVRFVCLLVFRFLFGSLSIAAGISVSLFASDLTHATKNRIHFEWLHNEIRTFDLIYKYFYRVALQLFSLAGYLRCAPLDVHIEPTDAYHHCCVDYFLSLASLLALPRCLSIVVRCCSLCFPFQCASKWNMVSKRYSAHRINYWARTYNRYAKRSHCRTSRRALISSNDLNSSQSICIQHSKL